LKKFATLLVLLSILILPCFGTNSEYKSSIEDYTKSIQLNPNNYQAYLNRGLNKSRLGDYNGAIEDYTRAIQINPRYSLAYSNRASAKGRLKDYNGAIADCDKAIQLDPNNSRAFFVRGLSKSKLSETTGNVIQKNITVSSNTNEADFGPYMRELQLRIKQNWDAPKLPESNHTILIFKINKNGYLSAIRVFKSSGNKYFDDATLAAVYKTAPFLPLPYNFKGGSIDIQFTFDYNFSAKKN